MPQHCTPHSDGESVTQVNAFLEWFVREGAGGISKAEFEDCKDGVWSDKVRDPKSNATSLTRGSAVVC